MYGKVLNPTVTVLKGLSHISEWKKDSVPQESLGFCEVYLAQGKMYSVFME